MDITPRVKIRFIIVIGIFGFVIAVFGRGLVRAAPPYGITLRVSISTDGTESNAESGWTAISADGQTVAFASNGSLLVPADTNLHTDIFVRHIAIRTTERVSVASGGIQSNGTSIDPSLSQDGRYVSFQSDATNLDTTPVSGMQLYWRDRLSDTTVLVSRNAAGIAGNDISGHGAIADDGQSVAFESSATNLVPNDYNLVQDIFVYNRATNQVQRVNVGYDGTEANGASGLPTLSANGRLVAFYSYATNLVPDDMNERSDVFVHDLITGETRRLSMGLDGANSNGTSTRPVVSADGQFVAFQSDGTNLVANDTNEVQDVFVTALANGETVRVSTASNGDESNGYSDAPDISNDGMIVVYYSRATNLVPGDTNEGGDIFWHNRKTGGTRRVSLSETDDQLNQPSDDVALDATGYRMAFRSYATNAVAHDTNEVSDVFFREEPLQLPPPTPTATPYANSLYLPVLTVRRTIADFPRLTILAGANDDSWQPRVADEGRVVAFLSDADDLGPPDNNRVTDVYVWYRDIGVIQRVSWVVDYNENEKPVTAFALSDNAEWVVFVTEESIVDGDTNGRPDVYRINVASGAVELVSMTTQGTAGDDASFAPDISADGRWVVFQTAARDLISMPMVDICEGGPCETVVRRDMETGITIPVAVDEEGYVVAPARTPSISSDGQRVAFEWIKYAGATVTDGPRYNPFIYRASPGTGELTLMASSSVAYPICTGGGSTCVKKEHTISRIAPDGDKVAWDTYTYAMSQYGGEEAQSMQWQGNGSGENIYSFYYGWTMRAAQHFPIVPGRAVLSHDASVVAFEVVDLVPTSAEEDVYPEMEDDSNGFRDIYVMLSDFGTYVRITRDDAGGGSSNGNSTDPDISNNGRVVVFASRATNLGPYDSNGDALSIYVWEWTLAPQ